MREYLSLGGGTPLQGTITVSGAKNSALPMLIATLLSGSECVLSNVPDLEDISVLLRLLRSIGAQASFSEGTAHITAAHIKEDAEAPYSLVKALRASFWVLAPLLARNRYARVALPGGDAIGSRPVDLHLRGLSAMGADIRMRHGVVVAQAPGGLRPADIRLDYPSVGATHQLLMAAALIPGKTVIRNAAREPEVRELAEFLGQLGAGVGYSDSESIIEIEGRAELGGAARSILGDRIEGVTYLTAGFVSGGCVTVKGIAPSALTSALDVLSEAGARVERGQNEVTILGGGEIYPVSFATAPYPGLATDAQPILMAALTKATGQSSITETVFENRFGHVAEYRRFGANIRVDGRTAVVSGVRQLQSAPVEGLDIRAAAGLLIMGLMADGVTTISEVHHLDRGYEGLVEKFNSLGARISRSSWHGDRELVYGC